MLWLPKHSSPQAPAGLREVVKSYREQPGHPRMGREGAVAETLRAGASCSTEASVARGGGATCPGHPPAPARAQPASEMPGWHHGAGQGPRAAPTAMTVGEGCSLSGSCPSSLTHTF